MAIEKSGKGKKVNLGWKMAKLQAMAGGEVSRKAKKAAEAELKKKSLATADDSSDDDDVDESVKQELSKQALAELEQVKAQKIENKIYHGKKVLLKTIKQAKQQEIQRLTKRIRELQKLASDEAGQKENKMKKTKQDLPALELELELTQNISAELVDKEALYARLAKHPVLATHPLMAMYVQPLPENPDFPLTAEYVKKKYPSGTPSEIKTNLLSIILPRLKNVKTVREHLSQLMDDLELIATGRKYEKPAKPQQQDKQQDKDGKADKKQRETVSDDAEEAESDGDDGDDEEELGNDSDNSYGVYDDGYDSDGLPLPMNGQSKGSSREPSSLFIGSLNASSKEDKKRKRGSKDEWVDTKFDEIYGKVKRNRKGQRARRALAEKKYGKQANHIIKAQEEEKKRLEEKAAKKAARDARRAARAAAGIVPDAGSSANATKLHNQRSMGGQAPTAAPAKPKTEAAAAAADPSLHPSWLAKKSEAAAVAAALAGGKSNKIVFDDSD
ncbi:hypothetical protein BGZ73_002987 [Actinomortierella ambigua]|nr:hypothetical protein BGZ73_002987 [Actinomortierella ambigua]